MKLVLHNSQENKISISRFTKKNCHFLHFHINCCVLITSKYRRTYLWQYEKGWIALEAYPLKILLVSPLSRLVCQKLNTSTLKESPTFASLICYSDSRTVQGHLLLPHLSIEQEKSRNGANSDHLTCYASILLFLIKLFNILLSMTNWKMKYHWSLAKEHL